MDVNDHLAALLASLDEHQAVAANAPLGPLAVIAGAGAGKTRTVVARVGRLIAEGHVRPADVVCITHTSKGAEEMRHRLLDIGARGVSVSTIHALARRVVIAAHGEAAAQVQASTWGIVRRAVSRVLGEAAAEQSDLVSDTASMIELARSLRLPINQLGYRHPGVSGVSTDAAISIAAAYKQIKSEQDIIDFADLIEMAIVALNSGAMPDRGRCLFVDEHQDTDPLQWAFVTAWLAGTDHITVCGDGRQCHPAGTMIATSAGPTAIENLDPAIHALRYISRHNANYANMIADGANSPRRPIRFVMDKRPYVGEMMTISTDDRSVDVTPNHLCLARWDRGKFNSPNAQVLYLMRRGSWWRIGKTNLRGTNNDFGPRSRLSKEKGDALWIIGITTDAQEITKQEIVLATRYGLPMTTFEPPVMKKEWRDHDHFADVFGRMEGFMSERAMSLLVDHGLDPAFPFLETEVGGRGHGCKAIMEIRAVNLQPGWMNVPVDHGRTAVPPDFVPFEVERRPFEGDVYSIEVERHHNYVANGISVHNCIFGFKGSDPTLLQEFESEFTGGRRVELPANYRSTPQVVAAANRLVAGKNYGIDLIAHRPDGSELSISSPGDDGAEADSIVSMFKAENRQGRPWTEMAVLVRFNSQTAAFETALGQAGIPFQIAGKEVSFFKRKEIVGILKPFVTAVKSEPAANGAELLVRCAEQTGHDRELAPAGQGKLRQSWDGIEALLGSVETSVGLSQMTAEDLLVELRERRDHSMSSPEGVTISTIHSAKGLEWAVVAVASFVEGVFPSSFAKRTDELNEELRCVYVAVTRAKDRLILSIPQNKQRRFLKSRGIWTRPAPHTPSRFYSMLRPTPARLTSWESLLDGDDDQFVGRPSGSVFGARTVSTPAAEKFGESLSQCHCGRRLVGAPARTSHACCGQHLSDPVLLKRYMELEGTGIGAKEAFKRTMDSADVWV